MIQLNDVQAENHLIRDELTAAMSKVLDSGRFINDDEVYSFESAFAAYVGAKYCVALDSGTAALHLALVVAGIGANDEVIVPTNTFTATAEAVVHAGAVPVFADIDPDSYTISIASIEDCLTNRTRAIIPVHMYGLPADLDEIHKIARTNNSLEVIEDAAHAHGAEYRGNMIGEVSEQTCFSFFCSKILGALGDGGCVTTNSQFVYNELCALRNHGRSRAGGYERIGYNYRMDEMQAAVLRVKLSHLNEYVKRRNELANLYTELFFGHPIITPIEMIYAPRVHYLYVIQVVDRDVVIDALQKAGIAWGIHYNTPLHKLAPYKDYAQSTFCHNAEAVSEHILSLPLYPSLKAEQVVYIAKTVTEACK